MLGGATGGAMGGDPLPTSPRGQNPARPVITQQGSGQGMDKDVLAALADAERLVAQTTTRLAAEEAGAGNASTRPFRPCSIGLADDQKCSLLDAST